MPLDARRVISSELIRASECGSLLCRRSGSHARRFLSGNRRMGSRAYARLSERFGEVRTLLELCSSPETKPEEHRAAASADAALDY
jgi:hypothetical protein